MANKESVTTSHSPPKLTYIPKKITQDRKGKVWYNSGSDFYKDKRKQNRGESIMRKRDLMRGLALVLACAMAFAPSGVAAQAEEAQDSAIAPHEAVYGYFADTYRNNADSNKTPETNPTIGVLVGFEELWKPGSTWNNGTVLNEAVIRHNIEESYKIARGRTEEEAVKAYEVEQALAQRLTLDGLGEYSDTFIELSGIGTTASQWSPKKSKPLFASAHIVRFMRNVTNVSTTPAKNYYDFPRPFRWDVNTIEIITEDKECESSLLAPNVPVKETSSGGFPSGHTNAIFLTSYGMAYGFPQRFHEILMTAAENGNYRVVAGVHSCLDVMGGRMTATALAGSIFANKEDGNYHVMPEAYQATQENLFKDVIPAVATLADYEAYQKNLEQFMYYLTYDFEPIHDTTQPMRVPKGAESILETRLPYLDDTQRRYVIYTTGLPSGYPLLDDAEGWGRVNYYKAAAGYGAFVNDVVVNMDASLGAYNASDSWLNDISGEGGLTLQGSGRLALVGKNTFTGGVTVEGGELVMVSDTALGTGNVKVTGGVLSETVDGVATISGDFEQTKGKLVLGMDSTDDVLNIAGTAKLGGTLIVEIAEGANIAFGTAVLSAEAIDGNFEYIEVRGIDGYSAKVQDNKVVLVDAGEVPDMTPPTEAPTAAPTETPEDPGQDGKGNLLPFYVIIVGLGVVAGVTAARMKRKNK